MKAWEIRRHMAYDGHAGGKSWSMLAEELGYPNTANVCRAARLHAKAHSLPWPVSVRGVRQKDREERNRRIYEARASGATWEEVAEVVGWEGEHRRIVVTGFARDHARQNGLAWPPLRVRRKRQSYRYAPDRPLRRRAAEAYRLAEQGLPWKEVALMLEYSRPKVAMGAAKLEAKRQEWVWPPKRRR